MKTFSGMLGVILCCAGQSVAFALRGPLTDMHRQYRLTQFPYNFRGAPGALVLLVTVFRYRNKASLSKVAGLGPPIFFI
jgi:hypothetical protein